MSKTRLAALIVTALAWPGCNMPQDPQQSLEQIQGGAMRVGITENEPWTGFTEGRPRGIEVDLLREFAQQWDAKIEWVRDSESDLIEALHQHKLHVVVGGLTESSPWSSTAGFTQPYITAQGKARVVAVPAGENRLLLELDKFLQARKPSIRQALREESRE